jgi:flagellar hook-associated protein 2
MTSATNTFKGVVSGVDITIAGTSDKPVTITSEKASTEIKVALRAFVENYNKFKLKLNEETAYVDASTAKGNVLTFNSAARQFDRVLSNVLMKRVYNIPGITSLQSLGITTQSAGYDDEGLRIGGDGTLKFDETVFDSLYSSNPDSVRDFFYQATETTDAAGKTVTTKHGWAQSFEDAVNSLTDPDYGVVSRELNTLGRKIDSNEERITFLTERLDAKRLMMLTKFYAMEQTMAKMSDDMSSVSNIASSWASNLSG